MKQRLEPLSCRIHDAIVCSGSDEEQELCFDWYQKQAQQEPCPACEAVASILDDHERTSVKPKLRAMLNGLWLGFVFFLAGVCVNSTNHSGAERWTTIAALLLIGICGLWSTLLKRTLV